MAVKPLGFAHMTRRSRAPRARKDMSEAASPSPRPSDVLAPRTISAMQPVSRPVEATETDELSALEAGWDELLA